MMTTSCLHMQWCSQDLTTPDVLFCGRQLMLTWAVVDLCAVFYTSSIVHGLQTQKGIQGATYCSGLVASVAVLTGGMLSE